VCEGKEGVVLTGGKKVGKKRVKKMVGNLPHKVGGLLSAAV